MKAVLFMAVSTSRTLYTPRIFNYSAAKTAKVGEAVRDGKFEFVVQGVECGKKKWLVQRLTLYAKPHKANTA